MSDRNTLDTIMDPADERYTPERLRELLQSISLENLVPEATQVPEDSESGRKVAEYKKAYDQFVYDFNQFRYHGMEHIFNQGLNSQPRYFSGPYKAEGNIFEQWMRGTARVNIFSNFIREGMGKLSILYVDISIDRAWLPMEDRLLPGDFSQFTDPGLDKFSELSQVILDTENGVHDGIKAHFDNVRDAINDGRLDINGKEFVEQY